MKQSEIRVNVELDDKNIPEKIFWAAEDLDNKVTEAKALNISVWEHSKRETLRLELWTKDMPVTDMKLMCIDTIGGMAQTIKNATGDEEMANAMQALCKELVEHVKKEQQKQQ